MKRIPLTQGKFAIVDDEDYEYLNQWKWFAYKNYNTYYAARQTRLYKKQKTIHMHCMIMPPQKGKVTDHINHNGLDNRKINLRSCTTRQNLQNQLPRKNCSSKYKGVCWDKWKKRWQARIWCNYKVNRIGVYKNEIDAAKAYNRKAREFFGEYAYLNDV